jgi:hypothetical protein
MLHVIKNHDVELIRHLADTEMWDWEAGKNLEDGGRWTLGESNSAMSAQEVLRAYIDAYNAKDVSAMLACFDDACVFENISGGKITVRTKGKAELEDCCRD